MFTFSRPLKNVPSVGIDPSPDPARSHLRMTRTHSLTLSLQPGPDGCERESGHVAPCGIGWHGSTALAISVSAEHSCLEKLSVSPQAGTGQRDSGHVSQ